MTISVTADHIELGAMQSCLSCPLAIALMAATGRQWEVASDKNTLEAQTRYPIHSEVVTLPQECADFVNTFDRTGGGEPFEFELEWRAS